MKRSTKTRDEAIAILIGAKFEHEYQRRRAGLAVYDSYAKPLAPAVEHWIKSLNVTDGVRDTRSTHIHRALDRLKLSTFADLDDLSRLERNLLALEGTRGCHGPINRLTLLRTFQGTLKQFTKWCAGNRRYMPEDPLAHWELIHVPADLPRRRRRAASPAEVARALLAAEALDRLTDRPYPTAIFFTSLLITGARFGALRALDVSSLLRDSSKLDLGQNVGRKRKGDARLDARTMLELTAYVGERTAGPLFLNTLGGPVDHNKTLKHWRESFRFALVDELWPEGSPRSLELIHHVTYLLSCGRVPSVGGNPLRLRAETVSARQEHEREVQMIAERLREVVEARMDGIDLHALRKTHRTWAEAAGVHPLLIDKQIGHATAAGGAALEAARDLIVSPTGRKHYVDMGLDMIDARRSAEAVRKLVDDAGNEVLGSKSGTIFSNRPEQTAEVLELARVV